MLTVKAQNNTYNMVLEMTNGTKINIGPNEIKSIYDFLGNHADFEPGKMYSINVFVGMTSVKYKVDITD